MEKIWKELSSNLKENPKATLVQTQEAGRGLVAICDLQRHGQINYRTSTIQDEHFETEIVLNSNLMVPDFPHFGAIVAFFRDWAPGTLTDGT